MTCFFLKFASSAPLTHPEWPSLSSDYVASIYSAAMISSLNKSTGNSSNRSLVQTPEKKKRNAVYVYGSRAVEWIKRLYVTSTDGRIAGFHGGTFLRSDETKSHLHSDAHCGHIAMTYTALACLKAMGVAPEDLEFDTAALLRGVRALQRPDGRLEWNLEILLQLANWVLLWTEILNCFVKLQLEPGGGRARYAICLLRRRCMPNVERRGLFHRHGCRCRLRLRAFQYFLRRWHRTGERVSDAIHCHATVMVKSSETTEWRITEVWEFCLTGTDARGSRRVNLLRSRNTSTHTETGQDSGTTSIPAIMPMVR